MTALETLARNRDLALAEAEVCFKNGHPVLANYAQGQSVAYTEAIRILTRYSAPVETWRDVPGFEGRYQASDQGRIKSVGRVSTRFDGIKFRVSERILSPRTSPSRDSYPMVSLSDRVGGKQKNYAIHRLVLLAFVGEDPEKPFTRHIDDDKTNSALVNLRWGSPRENNLDAVRNGRNYNAEKTHCVRGHEYTPENTRVLSGIDGRTRRNCWTCRRAKYPRKEPAPAPVVQFRCSFLLTGAFIACGDPASFVAPDGTRRCAYHAPTDATLTISEHDDQRAVTE